MVQNRTFENLRDDLIDELLVDTARQMGITDKEVENILQFPQHAYSNLVAWIEARRAEPVRPSEFQERRRIVMR